MLRRIVFPEALSISSNEVYLDNEVLPSDKRLHLITSHQMEDKLCAFMSDALGASVEWDSVEISTSADLFRRDLTSGTLTGRITAQDVFGEPFSAQYEIPVRQIVAIAV